MKKIFFLIVVVLMISSLFLLGGCGVTGQSTGGGDSDNGGGGSGLIGTYLGVIGVGDLATITTYTNNTYFFTNYTEDAGSTDTAYYHPTFNVALGVSYNEMYKFNGTPISPEQPILEIADVVVLTYIDEDELGDFNVAAFVNNEAQDAASLEGIYFYVDVVTNNAVVSDPQCGIVDIALDGAVTINVYDFPTDVLDYTVTGNLTGDYSEYNYLEIYNPTLGTTMSITIANEIMVIDKGPNQGIGLGIKDQFVGQSIVDHYQFITAKEGMGEAEILAGNFSWTIYDLGDSTTENNVVTIVADDRWGTLAGIYADKINVDGDPAWRWLIIENNVIFGLRDLGGNKYDNIIGIKDPTYAE